MAESKRKNKPGAGGARPKAGRKPSGRTCRISTFLARPEEGNAFKAEAKTAGVAPLFEKMWRVYRAANPVAAPPLPETPR